MLRISVNAILKQLGSFQTQVADLSAELHGQVNRECDQLSQVNHNIRRVECQNGELTARLNDLGKCIKNGTAAGLRCHTLAVEHTVLKSLDYDCRLTRRDAIHDAYKSTFEWIFTNPSGSNTNTHHFLEWLEKDDGIFWIRGKAGAGKSTLMEFIRRNTRTKQALQIWANPSEVFIASHYFWSSGSQLQRSYGGLLRSILFEIFSQIPAIIAAICREESWWPEDAGSVWKAPILPEWSDATLTNCLMRLASADNLPVEGKFCFLIDGLDEYDGHVNGERIDYLDMCRKLSELTASARIKICVSSRPSINMLSDQLGGDSSRVLDVQDLTAHDIQHYARGRLIDLDWTRLALTSGKTPSQMIHSLVEQISRQSHGVFLWVYLVVRLLREGHTDGGSFEQLQNRLEGLPSDLEPFFRRILEGVGPCYHQEMAGFLRIALEAHIYPLPFGIYTAHQDEYNHVRPFLGKPMWAAMDEVKADLKSRIDRRLQASTRGLLEINIHGEVDFLHRSARDFLRTTQMEQFLVDKSHKDFTPNIAIIRAALAIWKSPDPIGLLARLFHSQRLSFLETLAECILRFCMYITPKAQIEDSSRTSELINQWERATAGSIRAHKSRIEGETEDEMHGNDLKWHFRDITCCSSWIGHQ